MYKQKLFLLLFSVSITFVYTVASSSTLGSSKVCTYFGNTRISSPQGNLVNCTWYASNACCKRTEVTSVFGSMYSLYKASSDCQNMMNYMMCYFCSPEQYRWYDKAVHICEEFCDQIYEKCQDVVHDGQSIMKTYSNGVEFCEGQKFIVVSGTECFNFDPDVFGSANHILPSHLAADISIIFAYLAYSPL